MPRWRQQGLLLLGALVWLLWVLAMLTHHAGDPAFTTSGTGDAVRNRAGLLGARASDLALFLWGYSSWWLVPVGLRAWLVALAGVLRGPQAAARPPRWLFWLGLALLLCASCALEWTRLYRWEPLLPGHAGGVLGYMLGPLSMRWLGFAGSGVLWIALLVVGMSLALGFSWLRLADAIGERLGRLREDRIEKRERQEDRQGQGSRHGEGGAERHAHEGCRAGRSDQYRQRAGGERIDVGVSLAPAAWHVLRQRRNRQGTGERQAQGEEQQRHGADERRRLQLEPPAEEGPSGFQGQQEAGQREKGADDSQGIEQGMPATLPPAFHRLTGMTCQAEQLDREDREDTGHQIEQDATDKRQPDHRRE